MRRTTEKNITLKHSDDCNRNLMTIIDFPCLLLQVSNQHFLETNLFESIENVQNSQI